MPRRIVVVLAGAFLSACLWRSYESILEVHVTLLLQMTDKLAAMSDSGRTPTAADIVEFTYPAQRGRDFLRAFRRSSDRPSYQSFGKFLDHYETMLQRIDAARVSPSAWQAEPPRLLRDRETLTALAGEIRRDLHR
ncbi:MAG TPA: hypothetical protein VMW17_23305 [Candidatus Binatia bacterium]|nr:hypothetical protein [Candidatus Binatia bacterium]